VSLVLDLVATIKRSFRIGTATLDADGLSAARTFTLPDASGTLALAGGGGGSSLSGTSVITLPGARGVFEWSETVAAPGVLATDSLFVFFAKGSDVDENGAETLDPTCNPVATASLDQITFDASFRELTSGPIKLSWKVL
jgi:hypothetical protein